MTASFDAALEAVERLLPDGDPEALHAALGAVSRARPVHPTAEQFTRMASAALRALGAEAPDAAYGAIAWEPGWASRTAWAAQQLAADCFHDRGARNRDFVEGDARRQRALMRPLREGTFDHHEPRMHVPLDLGQAEAVAAPWLAMLDRARESDPLAHLRPCWEALTAPQPPFDAVIRGWLADRDGAAVERAMALAALSRAGVQRVSARDLEEEVLAQLSDPHPLVAAHAGQFLGGLMADPVRINGGAPSWGEVMARIAALPPAVRLAAAGGFLNGADDGLEGFYGPFDAAGVARGAAEDWVFDVLDGAGDDPALPDVQSFWFPLHEAWSRRADLAERLIEAGEPWIAYMCATEERPVPEGMRGVLERLAADGDADLAASAARVLEGSPEGS